MKFYSFLILLLLFFNFSKAQKAFKANYRVKVFNVGANDVSKLYFTRLLLNNSVLVCNCNESYNRRSMITSMKDGENIKTDKHHDVTAHNTGAYYDVISYRDRIYRSFVSFHGKEDNSCAKLDTAHMKLVPTNEKVKIGEWLCTKYISQEKEYKSVIVWVSSQLPWYINPGFFLMNKTAGIVRIEFKNKGEITLENLSPIDFSKIAFNDNRNCTSINKTYNPLHFQLMDL